MKYQFRVSKLSDGLVAYLQIRSGKSWDTIEFKDGKVFGDYNREGKLIGIEFLQFCDVEVPDDRRDL